MSGHAGGGRGRRRGGGHEEEHVNHERWLVSYSDMITVLMALFIVLFAISQVDQEKYIALRESLSAGFADMGSPSSPRRHRGHARRGVHQAADRSGDGHGRHGRRRPRAR